MTATVIERRAAVEALREEVSRRRAAYEGARGTTHEDLYLNSLKLARRNLRAATRMLRLAEKFTTSRRTKP